MRGCSQLPPAIPEEANRPLLWPEGKTHWLEIPRLGKERKPASVLTCLLKTHHPGIVQFRGKSMVATTWKHYKAEKDTDGRSKADEVEGFWEKYKRKYIELNGEGFDWLHSPVDARALYGCSSGRPHGKWATFNGIIDDREALVEVRNSHISSTASKRQHREEEEHARRRESHNARLAKEYAQSSLDWSSSVHSHNSNIQRFMESVAEHTGMPPSVVPPPLPPPPTYEVSTSQNQSLQNNQTNNSAIDVENPDDTLRRIAQGIFGGNVNTSSSASENYSPPLDDLAPY